MMSTVTCGTLLMLAAGMLNTGNLVMSKIIGDREWPYFRMFGMACFLNSLISGTVILVTRVATFERPQCKWVALRGFFGVLTFFLAVFAVSQGTPMGDVATLTSVNMVMAAFLGRLLLKEPLRPVHVLALICTLVGAVLISKPSFLFPSEAATLRWLGCLLALASGFCDSCIYICSRKIARMSPWVHFCSAMLQGCVGGLLMPLLPMVTDPPVEVLFHSPPDTATWLGLMAAGLLSAGMIFSAGSRLCPAAVSATMSTGVGMASSYAAQALLFGQPLEPVTLTGAALMLGSVMLMAGTSGRTNVATDGAQAAAASAGGEIGDELSSMGLSSLGEDADRESLASLSLASFIATEFVASPLEKTVRQRRPPAEPVAQQLGAVVAAMAVSA